MSAYLTHTVKSLVALSMLLLFNAACSLTPSKVAMSLPPADLSAPDLSTAVAQVNGKEITRAELNRAKKIILANKPGLQVPPLLQKEFEMQALNQLISSELLFQASRTLEIKDLDKQAEDQLARIKKSFPEGKDYARELQKIGVDEEGLLESTRREVAIVYYVNSKIAPHISVSEEEIKKFYEQNPDKFRHIILLTDQKKTETLPLSAAREKIENYLRVQKTNGAIEAFVAEARKNAKINVLL